MTSENNENGGLGLYRKLVAIGGVIIIGLCSVMFYVMQQFISRDSQYKISSTEQSNVMSKQIVEISTSMKYIQRDVDEVRDAVDVLESADKIKIKNR